MRIKQAIFIILTFSASIFASENSIAKQLEAIPLGDREILDTFFRELLFFQGFAYTLFGDKPISDECFDLEEKRIQLFSTSPKGYKTWKKYAHLFTFQNYVFIFNEEKERDLCEITLVNKRAFYQIFEKHKEKFREAFGKSIQAATLLQLIIQKKSLWNTPITWRNDLTGILLGYGERNANLFHKRSEILMRNRKFKKKRSQPSPDFSTIEEELAALNQSLQAFSDEGKLLLRFMRLPGFVADPNSKETKELQNKYKEQRKQITTRYAHGNILEVTLTQLSAEPALNDS